MPLLLPLLNIWFTFETFMFSFEGCYIFWKRREEGGSAVVATLKVSRQRSEGRSSLRLPSSSVPLVQIMQIPDNIMYVHVYILFFSCYFRWYWLRLWQYAVFCEWHMCAWRWFNQVMLQCSLEKLDIFITWIFQILNKEGTKSAQRGWFLMYSLDVLFKWDLRVVSTK
jgi:hypothetical protein